MIDRSRAGVMVAFLYDEVGSDFGKQYAKDLTNVSPAKRLKERISKIDRL